MRPTAIGLSKKNIKTPLLEVAKKHGIEANFAGHLHRNNIVSTDYIEVVTSGPVGYPLGQDPSGLRRSKLRPKGLSISTTLWRPLKLEILVNSDPCASPGAGRSVAQT
ncbi:MAG: hypothetical protein CM1200mP39_22500 [Dehalococcoidia bacterium]|nr:MAG: hypothetical protein CM1200mP39_22500 [Dehalococcoidia bacterium]